MKQIYFLAALLVGCTFTTQAQNTVEVDANATFVGFANVFELPVNGGAYAFGSGWGVEDIKTTVDPGAGTITLQPNFNTYADNPTDPYWVNQTTGEGNKIFEGNTYVEDNTLVGSELTFNGRCTSYTMDGAYTVMAFIKVFNSDFSVVKIEEVALVEGANFSVVYTNVEGPDAVVQYGFYVSGVNANPADEGTLGSVVVTAPSLGLNDNETVNAVAYPNPTNTVWNVTSQEVVKTITLYNILGAKVQTMEVNTTSIAISTDELASGIYLAHVATDIGVKTIKLIKQ